MQVYLEEKWHWFHSITAGLGRKGEILVEIGGDVWVRRIHSLTLVRSQSTQHNMLLDLWQKWLRTCSSPNH